VTPQWRGKWIEKGLFNLIEAGDFRAISFYLTCMAKDRGYGLPSTSPLGGSATVAISTINILAVPTGQFVGESTAGARSPPGHSVGRSCAPPAAGSFASNARVAIEPVRSS
jgi:hypothetical protein